MTKNKQYKLHRCCSYNDEYCWYCCLCEEIERLQGKQKEIHQKTEININHNLQHYEGIKRLEEKIKEIEKPQDEVNRGDIFRGGLIVGILLGIIIGIGLGIGILIKVQR